MPSPLGHALGGALVAALVTRATTNPRSDQAARLPHSAGSSAWWRRGLPAGPVLALAMAAGCGPDVDFLWGRHNMETHSVGAALFAGLGTWAWMRHWRLGVVVALAWTTHVAFDWLGSDDTPPLGVMAMWPLTTTFYFADAFVFEAISRRYWLPGFWTHNLWAVVTEACLLGPLLAAAVRWRAR